MFDSWTVTNPGLTIRRIHGSSPGTRCTTLSSDSRWQAMHQIWFNEGLYKLIHGSSAISFIVGKDFRLLDVESESSLGCPVKSAINLMVTATGRGNTAMYTEKRWNKKCLKPPPYPSCWSILHVMYNDPNQYSKIACQNISRKAKWLNHLQSEKQF